jgi:acetyl esterase/lipase
MEGPGGSRSPTRTVLAACVLSMILAAGCAAGGATPSAIPVSVDRTAPPTEGASPAAIASPAASAVATLPIRSVLDVPYLHSLLPASSVGIEPGTEVKLDVYAPTTGGRWPVVVWAPGGRQTKLNGWSFGEAMAARGAVVFVIDTVHSMNPEDPPLGIGSRTLVEMASCAVRTARALAPEYGGDPKHVVWSGHSLGGVFGFELALADPAWERMWTEQVASNGGPGPTVECLTKGGADRIDAIVTAGAGRFIEMWPTAYDADPAVRAFTESVSHVGNNPSLVVRLVHGDMDPEQPFAVAEGLERELSAAGYDATLTRVDLGGHAPFFEQVIAQIVGVVGSPGW